LSCALIAALVLTTDSRGETAPATYLGGRACAACHQAESARWTGSHHDLAMQPADATTVLGNFDNATFTKDSVNSTFFHRDGAYYVRTDGPDGKMHDYRIAYTFGVAPLQQYLIELPGGRFQALGLAWDTRPAAAGGQRWFDLYPSEHIDHRDALHWTGPMQNWNFMCADCHSTNLRKNYRAAQDRFQTTWSDLDVSCEACHGPASRHVQWAADARAGAAEQDPLRGFAVALRDTSGGRWELAPGASTAHRTAPRSSAVELETCGRCHARTARIWENDAPGDALAQTRRLTLLDAHRYHADGQIDDEVYEYGSFVQSKMYRAGVTCSDCHDPHSGQLRAAGNALCAQCHRATAYDVVQHHHHTPGTAGAQCVSCHMTERTYMIVDRRRDHSIRVPRPDLSERLGTPNACSDCHADKPARWAAAAVTTWYGARQRPWHFGEALAAGRAGRPGAVGELLRTIDDASLPPIARATAITLLPVSSDPRAIAAVRRAASDPDPLVRRAAAEGLMAFDAAPRVEIGVPLLGDPVRSVRLEAVASLLDVPRSAFSVAQLAALDHGIAEYRQAQGFNADRAEAQLNLGMLEARLGNFAAARQAFETAMRLQPSFVPAYVDLADLQRRQGDEVDAAATVRRALQFAPDDAAVHEALGLSLVRQQRLRDALPELAKAAQLAPEVARYAYVHAIALHDTGDVRAAIDVLTRAHERHTGTPEILIALAEYEAETGNRAAALVWARRLAQISDDPETRRLIAELERSQ
jgi:predicted CXXCH cytochrome family protein